MSMYLIGYGINAGSFLNDNKESVDYNSRYIRCVSDDNNDSSKNFGFSGFEVKIKTADLSKSLGVSESAVDEVLKKLYKKQIDLVYMPTKNELKIIGIRPVYDAK
ncbi:MAG: hypothetical protein NC205_06875 [Prevotella sp.]|nr:hypothetical protein [Alistipes senegalensis]MCM1358302.1 hypothetical protein [Prevotella sp.]